MTIVHARARKPASKSPTKSNAVKGFLKTRTEKAGESVRAPKKSKGGLVVTAKVTRKGAVKAAPKVTVKVRGNAAATLMAIKELREGRGQKLTGSIKDLMASLNDED